MRKVSILTCMGAGAVVLAAMMADSALGACGQGCGQSGWGHISAPACGAPSYGSMTPGCCQCQPSRCDNVWDGYCQERQRRGCCWWFCRPVACQPTPACIPPVCGCQVMPSSCGGVLMSEPAAPMPGPISPTPALQVAPEPEQIRP
ncbi:MAG: hypothetical protein JW818_00325 [Pirellulales bacterium]|nr:hypothetical protein [Pirellulales bacterium]